jgi:hypothetical protein
MFSLVLQPVLAAAGELHELVHGMGEAHLVLDETTTAMAEAEAHDEAGEQVAGVLHLAHHLAHCCGQSAAPALAELFVPAIPKANAAVPDWRAERPATGLVLAPFRPPISA